MASAVGAAIAWAWGCGTLESTSTTTDAAVDSATSSDGDVTLDGGATCHCLPPTPDGWDGPLVVDELADCTAPWTDRVEHLHGGLDGGTQTCGCSCSAPPSRCLRFNFYSNTCSSTNGTCTFIPIPIDAGVCYPGSDTCANHMYVIEDGGGPCKPTAVNEHDPVGWGLDARLCHGAVQGGVCADGKSCAPAHSPTSGYCIAHDGAIACPPTWPLARTYYADATDDRSCTACTCGDGGAACEVGQYATSACDEGNRVATEFPPACTLAAANVKLIREGAACVPDGGAKIGSVVPTGQRTVCCVSD